MRSAFEPFQIKIGDVVLDDMHDRLKRTRLPDVVTESSWQQGTDLSYFKRLLRYWINDYDWRKREEELNSFKHFRANIDGFTLHFIHEKSRKPGAVPILLMQGWPSSFVQVLDILPLLCDHADKEAISFDVVAVSLPGYAFTEIPPGSYPDFNEFADITLKLMVDVLGYERFAVRGSDQGALVQQQIALKYPDRIIGIHRSGITPFLNPLPPDLNDEEKAYQKQVAKWAQTETVYARLHSLTPETLLPAITDSPAGLASWILEKFQRWGDCGTDPGKHFGIDKLLDNICLHWFAGSGANAIRLYHNAAHNADLVKRIDVPAAIAMPLRDGITIPAPRCWAERFYNVRQWTVMESGGHFSEWEIPYELARDIRKFFLTLI